MIHEPNDLLHQKSDPVEDFMEMKRIADDLLVTIKRWALWRNPWLGIAGPQLGFMRRVIVLRHGWSRYMVMVNPALLQAKIPFPFIETCYSVDGIYLVKRHLWVKIRYQDMSGILRETVITGPSAIYQEIDHLNGILVSQIGLRIL